MMSLQASENDLSILNIKDSTHHADISRALAVSVVVSVALVGIAFTQPISGALALLFLVPALAVSIARGPQRRIQKAAQEVRYQVDLATSVFLDLVNVMIAGGAGIETAVLAAAHVGDGQGFMHIRTAIMRAHSARMSYWDALEELGSKTGVSSLIEVAHTVQLAGQHGARVRASLAVKAQAIRTKNLARIESSAEQMTEKMGLPLVVLFIGFLILIGYPAFTQTMSAL